MADLHVEMDHALMVDGNALAGLLGEIFALEMTASPAECAHCGNVAAIGGLWAFTQAPGAVLRCPACEGVMLRIVVTPEAICLDARGVACLRLARRVD
jgi:hypothetical protein